jgi:hypothetical protein
MKIRKWAAGMLFCAFTIFTPLFSTQAQGLPFGGQVVFTLPCTCPATPGALMIFLAPFLGFGGPLPTAAITYVPIVSQLYAWYSIGVPGTWHLGSYIPGTGNLACWIINPVGFVPPCIPMPFPSVGTILQVGTSKLF